MTRPAYKVAGRSTPAKVPSRKHKQVENVSPCKDDTNSPGLVFRLKIDLKINSYNDGGITVDARSNQTMAQVMGIVCSEWLDILRNGDGSIDAHPWKVRGPPLAESVYIHRNQVEDRRTLQWREAHEICEKSKQTIPAYEKLESIQGLDKGGPLTVVYGIKHPTKFEIQLLQKYIPSTRHRFPMLIPSAADKLAQSFRLYNPPKFFPNLDDFFPHANKAMFCGGERWICPYPTSPSCGGFICGEFQRRFDVLFLPFKSSCLHEALVIMDFVMKEYPEFAGECSSRLALPVKLSPLREAKYDAYMQEPGCESRINDLIPNQKFDEFLCKHNTIVSRINKTQLLKYANIVDSMFPMCSRNYGQGLWASYHNRKVIIGIGNDRCGEERGVPRHIYAEVSYNVKSLHEFFCICEVLFQQAEEEGSKKLLERRVEAKELERHFELERHLASLRI